MRSESPDGETYNGELISSELECAEASREPEVRDAGEASAAEEKAACARVDITKGDLTCVRAVSIADAAISAGTDDINETTRVQGFDCYVYPYAVECSNGGSTKFDAKYGTNGAQTG